MEITLLSEIKGGAVGWAKRSVPTISHRARCCKAGTLRLPTLQIIRGYLTFESE